MAWKKFEKACFKYLSDKHSGEFSFKSHGQSDSTKADVEVISFGKSKFFIEIKEDISQCCQFVVFPNDETKKFEVSAGVKSPDTQNRRAIVKFMDERYKKFSKVGSSGISLDIDKDILYGWVNDFYTAKKVKFFITKGDEYIIFPISKFSYYFDISAVYRKKRSGSNEPNKDNNYEEIEAGIKENSISGDVEFAFVGNKNRCFFHTNSNIEKQRIVCSNYTYQFKTNGHSKKIKAKNDYVYEVRRLSNTNNPNVICQLSLKKKRQEPTDLLMFEKDLANKE